MSRPVPALSVVLLALLGLHCQTLDRDNPLDPARAGQAGPSAALRLEIAVPKALVRVVHRVVATLEGPGMQPVTKELSHPPLGPATGTIGSIPPGPGRVLTVQGYDLAGTLLFEGRATDLVIAAGDTSRVTVALRLVPEAPAVTPADTTGSG